MHAAQEVAKLQKVYCQGHGMRNKFSVWDRISDQEITVMEITVTLAMSH